MHLAVEKEDIYSLIERKFDRRKKTGTRLVDADRFKTYDEVFDHQNLQHIYRLMTRGDIETLECPISTGKEANVYKANTESGMAAVKIFRTATSTFGAFMEYIDGDRRFKNIDRSHRGIIYTWARKEFQNLSIMQRENIRVPSPRAVFKNVLVMDLVTYDGQPSPQIRVIEADPGHWEELWKWVKRTVGSLVKDCGLVHADLSEYNILYDGGPVLIDVGQAVDVGHPSAFEFLNRDVKVISAFFERKGIEGARAEALKLAGKLMPPKNDPRQGL